MRYILTIFISAFLLFQIQLMMGKMLLPWFGGTPSVWTSCMLFFQIMLLAGYAYAHAIGRYFSLRTQGKMQLTLISIAIIIIAFYSSRWGTPLIPSDTWKPNAGDHPVFSIILILLISVGLPFFLLSSTSPLLQHWSGHDSERKNTYRLYAISNAGSLLGLISYPFLFERILNLSQQTILWTCGFILYGIGIACTMRKLPADSVAPIQTNPTKNKERAAPVSPTTILFWLTLSMCTSALLLAVTNELCQEVASVPFLWMLPLVIYLTTFILCFDHSRWYKRRIFLVLAIFFTLVALITTSLNIRLGIITHICSFSIFLFFMCMTCHGELVKLKPPTEQLTLFYLCVSLGGALGGIFVGLIAPIIFKSYWEFNIISTLAWGALALLFLREKESLFYQGDWWHWLLILWLGLFLSIRFATMIFAPQIDALLPRTPKLLIPALASFLIAWLSARAMRNSRVAQSKYCPRLIFLAIIFIAECFMVVRIKNIGAETLATDRNFFGTLIVKINPPASPDIPATVQLTHGQINHGFQYLDEELRKVPVSYYGKGSGIETAIRFHPRRLQNKPLRIGVLGLGTGTMAAYAQKGDSIRFYEINPTVIQYSTQKKPFFSYLSECKANVEIRHGDARLMLERELKNPQQFDILVIDAFSSDSVPVHLLTIEAFQLYQKHLRDDDSIIAVNISNRFLDFRNLVANHADHIHLIPLFKYLKEQTKLSIPSQWMILTKKGNFTANPTVREKLHPWPIENDITWTDAYSNLWQILR